MATNARIEELKKKFDENPKRYFAPLANEYRKAGSPEEAISICEMYLHQQPGHMSGHIVYGQALFEAKRFDKAREIFEAALALDQENLIALKHLGDIARLTGDVYGARAWYLRILEADPRNEEIQGYIADLERQGGAVPPAPESVSQPAQDSMIELSEPFSAPLPEPEMELPETIVPFAPPPPPPPPPPPQFVTETMGDLYVDQGHVDEAITVYKQVAEQRPGDEALQRKIKDLQGEAVSSAETARQFFARIVAHKPDAGLAGLTVNNNPSPLDEFFGNQPASADSDAASQLAQAFADMDDQNSGLS